MALGISNKFCIAHKKAITGITINGLKNLTGKTSKRSIFDFLKPKTKINRVEPTPSTIFLTGWYKYSVSL
jgi:hypothetical protein